MKRLRLAMRYRMWPWQLPTNVVRFVSLQGPTKRDVERGEELARRYGWN